MAAQAPDPEMDHEYDQIVFPKTKTENQARASQSNPEFMASTLHCASLYPQLLRQLLQENDWGRHPVYKMEVLQQQEQAIAGMNIPPVELLKQVQGGNVYSSQTPIRSYEDALMATAFMPGMFNEDEAIPEFKPRIREKTVSPVKRWTQQKVVQQTQRQNLGKHREKLYQSMVKRHNLIDCQNPCLTG